MASTSKLRVCVLKKQSRNDAMQKISVMWSSLPYELQLHIFRIANTFPPCRTFILECFKDRRAAHYRLEAQALHAAYLFDSTLQMGYEIQDSDNDYALRMGYEIQEDEYAPLPSIEDQTQAIEAQRIEWNRRRERAYTAAVRTCFIVSTQRSDRKLLNLRKYYNNRNHLPCVACSSHSDNVCSHCLEGAVMNGCIPPMLKQVHSNSRIYRICPNHVLERYLEGTCSFCNIIKQIQV